MSKRALESDWLQIGTGLVRVRCLDAQCTCSRLLMHSFVHALAQMQLELLEQEHNCGSVAAPLCVRVWCTLGVLPSSVGRGEISACAEIRCTKVTSQGGVGARSLHSDPVSHPTLFEQCA